MRKPAGGELDPDTRTRNALLRSLRYQGERGFALMSQRWRTLQRVMLSPGKIGDITQCRARPGPVRAQNDQLTAAEETSVVKGVTALAGEAVAIVLAEGCSSPGFKIIARMASPAVPSWWSGPGPGTNLPVICKGMDDE